MTQMAGEFTVFVVDDNASVRKSLKNLLAAKGLASETFASGKEFLAAYDSRRPGCLLLDMHLRGESGLDLQDELRRRKVTLPIIIMTAYGNVPTSVRAFKAGAVDFLQKPLVPAALVERIRALVETDRRERELAASSDEIRRRMAALTPRERHVTKLLAEGKTSKEIAAVLNVSVRTVEGHRHMIFSKMGVSTAAQLVATIMRVGG